MKYKNTILAVTVVVISIAVFSVCFAPEKRIKQKITLDKSIKVFNYTADKGIDTIINIAAQILRVKNVTIVCAPIISEDEFRYLGYIQKQDGYYLIRIQHGLSEDLIVEVICHEMTHCEQHESGRMKKLYYGYQYEEFTYTFYTPYFERKFELDSFKLELILKHQVKSLYK